MSVPSDTSPAGLLAAAEGKDSEGLHRLVSIATSIMDDVRQRLVEQEAKAVDPTLSDAETEAAAAEVTRLSSLSSRYGGAVDRLLEQRAAAQVREARAKAMAEYDRVAKERAQLVEDLRGYEEHASAIVELLGRLAKVTKQIAVVNATNAGPHIMPVESAARGLTIAQINQMGSLLDGVRLPHFGPAKSGLQIGARTATGMWSPPPFSLNG